MKADDVANAENALRVASPVIWLARRGATIALALVHAGHEQIFCIARGDVRR
jgi:hypothetical protein